MENQCTEKALLQFKDYVLSKTTTIEAWENGGQFLIITPGLGMTITFTRGNCNLFLEMEDGPFSILYGYMLPAITLG